jgi:hypothetical protein
MNVKAFLDSKKSHGIKQNEVRNLRNAIKSDAEGVTQAELDDLESYYQTHQSSFDRVSTLEKDRVRGLGIVQGADGKGDYEFQPYAGIDSTTRLRSLRNGWDVQDQFDAGFPTYQKSAEVSTVPAGNRDAGKKAAAAEIKKWHKLNGTGPEPVMGDLEPSYARNIYDLGHNLIGFGLTFVHAEQSITTEAVYRLDSSKNGFSKVSSRWQTDFE